MYIITNAKKKFCIGLFFLPLSPLLNWLWNFMRRNKKYSFLTLFLYCYVNILKEILRKRSCCWAQVRMFMNDDWTFSKIINYACSMSARIFITCRYCALIFVIVWNVRGVVYYSRFLFYVWFIHSFIKFESINISIGFRWATGINWYQHSDNCVIVLIPPLLI